MNDWKTEILAMIRVVLFNPDSDTALFAALAVAVLACIVATRICAGSFGLQFSSWPRALLSVAIPLAFAIASVTAVRLYVFDGETSAVTRVAVQVALVAFVVLAIGVPFQSALMKGDYFAGLLNTGVALIAAALLTTLFLAGWNAVVSGKTQMLKEKDRKDQIESQVYGTPVPSR